MPPAGAQCRLPPYSECWSAHRTFMFALIHSNVRLPGAQAVRGPSSGLSWSGMLIPPRLRAKGSCTYGASPALRQNILVLSAWTGEVATIAVQSGGLALPQGLGRGGDGAQPGRGRGGAGCAVPAQLLPGNARVVRPALRHSVSPGTRHSPGSCLVHKNTLCIDINNLCVLVAPATSCTRIPF